MSDWFYLEYDGRKLDEYRETEKLIIRVFIEPAALGREGIAFRTDVEILIFKGKDEKTGEEKWDIEYKGITGINFYRFREKYKSIFKKLRDDFREAVMVL